MTMLLKRSTNISARYLGQSIPIMVLHNVLFLLVEYRFLLYFLL